MPYQAGQPIDFRTVATDRIEKTQIGRETRRALIALNKEMGVRYSACDLILTEDGEEIFLESNVAGNWLFCDIHHDMGVTKDMARKLCGV